MIHVHFRITKAAEIEKSIKLKAENECTERAVAIGGPGDGQG